MNLETCARRAAEYLEQATHFLAAGETPGNFFLAARAAQAAAANLASRFHILPIIPHTMGPHHGMDWETAMVRCREIIKGLDPSRDVVVLLPGWRASRGACEERELAMSLGVKALELAEVMG